MLTSADYRDCVLLMPTGARRKGSTLYNALLPVGAAVEKLRTGHAAMIAPEDEEAVKAQWQPGTGVGTEEGAVEAACHQ